MVMEPFRAGDVFEWAEVDRGVRMPTIRIGGALILAIATLGFAATRARAADAPLSESQLVEIAIEANPAVKSARYRWDSAVHSIPSSLIPTATV
jgi:hypothetical protein